VYEKPVIVDYGDLVELTEATGLIGAEDGSGKRVHALVEVSLAVLP
jgi:hypothetical protein